MSPLQDVDKPPASPAAGFHFIVGQDQTGRWIALETHNLAGGLFKSRQDALHFADFETGHRPGAVEFATTPLQLRF